MLISEIISFLQTVAPLSLQEPYDNAGLLTGDGRWECTGMISALDVTEKVIEEAVQAKCNLVIAHHPLIFLPLKRIDNTTQAGRTLISAIKNDVAVYAIHTNLDNLLHGVNGKIADLLELSDRKILQAKSGRLQKLYTYVPHAHLETVRSAIFEVGAGKIGAYNECSFSSEGIGTFKAGIGTDPYVGQPGARHHEPESKLEVIFPEHLQPVVVRALKQAHPYEEVAYEIIELKNIHPEIGSGIIGVLPAPLSQIDLLQLLKERFSTPVIRYTSLNNKQISKIAVCGGSGSFLINSARHAGVEALISADFKYHDFFETDGDMMICDIGHYESEKFTIDLIAELIKEKFPTFAVLKTRVNTNPIQYFT